MVKSGRRHKATGRLNPIARSVKAPSDPELAAIREKKILPVIKDLLDPDTKKRTSAAVAVTNIIQDEKCRKLLLREQIVRILLEQTVTDASLESKSAGWGILTNLALEEEADFCIHLYRQDILTAIQGGIQTLTAKLGSQDRPVAKLSKAELQLLWNISSSIIGLISTLAEAQEEIFEAIAVQNIIPVFLFGLLELSSQENRVSKDLVNVTLSCLAILTEDNKVLAQQIVDRDVWISTLIEFSTRRVDLQGNDQAVVGLAGVRIVSSCAILHNVFSALEWFDHNTPSDGKSDQMLVPLLVQSMKEVSCPMETSNKNSNSDADRVVQSALEVIASIASSLPEALEQANKIEKDNEKVFEGFGDDEDDQDEAMGEDENGVDEAAQEPGTNGNDEMSQEEMETDMDAVIGLDADEDITELGMQETLELLIHQATPAALSFVRYTAESSELITTSALSALNNIAWNVGNIDYASSGLRFQKQWAPFAQEIWTKAISPVLASNTADIGLASSVVSLAWAVARSVQGRINLEQGEQTKFMALYQASKSLPDAESNGHGNGKSKSPEPDPFQSLGVKCIGVLGRLALSPAPLTLTREISIFLLTILASLPNTPPADAIEALNQLFDIYADEEFPCDEVFWKDGFYRHLEQLLPNVKKMAKGVDGRKLVELRERADEVVVNLVRFLKYKRETRQG